jgi:hypothetical protein
VPLYTAAALVLAIGIASFIVLSRNKNERQKSLLASSFGKPPTERNWN